MNQLEITMILEYIEEHLPELENTFDKDKFKDRSYSRWVAYEIVQRLSDFPFDPPEVIIENFIIELLGYSHTCTNDQADEMFKTMISAADDILCLVL